jgi:hypothetical protein
MGGIFLKEGDRVEQVDPQTGLSRMDTLEDERAFDTTEIERKITAPQSNRLILEELKKYADEHERRTVRFPKTLIFAARLRPSAARVRAGRWTKPSWRSAMQHPPGRMRPAKRPNHGCGRRSTRSRCSRAASRKVRSGAPARACGECHTCAWRMCSEATSTSLS